MPSGLTSESFMADFSVQKNICKLLQWPISLAKKAVQHATNVLVKFSEDDHQLVCCDNIVTLVGRHSTVGKSAVQGCPCGPARILHGLTLFDFLIPS